MQVILPPIPSMVLDFRLLSTMRTVITLIFAVITVCRAEVVSVNTPTNVVTCQYTLLTWSGGAANQSYDVVIVSDSFGLVDKAALVTTPYWNWLVNFPPNSQAHINITPSYDTATSEPIEDVPPIYRDEAEVLIQSQRIRAEESERVRRYDALIAGFCASNRDLISLALERKLHAARHLPEDNPNDLTADYWLTTYGVEPLELRGLQAAYDSILHPTSERAGGWLAWLSVGGGVWGQFPTSMLGLVGPPQAPLQALTSAMDRHETVGLAAFQVVRSGSPGGPLELYSGANFDVRFQNSDHTMGHHLLSTAEKKSRVGSSETFTYAGTVVIWSEGECIFTATLKHPEFILEELHGVPVPEEALYDKWMDGLLEAPNSLPPGTYVKRPQPESYEPNDPSIWVTNEAKIHEMLLEFAHPNICEYFGAVRKGDYCTGLAFRKYPSTLRAAVNEGKVLDRRGIFEGILHGINFIHSQGLVHNDLHPEIIMLDENGTPIIIDFDGSDVVGGTPLKTGTLGRWLRGKYDDKDQPIENPSEDAILISIINDTEFQLYMLLNAFDVEDKRVAAE